MKVERAGNRRDQQGHRCRCVRGRADEGRDAAEELHGAAGLLGGQETDDAVAIVKDGLTRLDALDKMLAAPARRSDGGAGGGQGVCRRHLRCVPQGLSRRRRAVRVQVQSRGDLSDIITCSSGFHVPGSGFVFKVRVPGSGFRVRGSGRPEQRTMNSEP